MNYERQLNTAPLFSFFIFYFFIFISFYYFLIPILIRFYFIGRSDNKIANKKRNYKRNNRKIKRHERKLDYKNGNINNLDIAFSFL